MLKKKNHSKQLQTNNMFTYDIGDPNCIYQRIAILLTRKPWTIYRKKVARE